MENGNQIKYGDNRNLEAIDFIKEMNTIVYREFPDIQTIAEDSSDFPKRLPNLFMMTD